MNAEIVIPASQSQKIMSLMLWLGAEFPDAKRSLLQVAHEAREGVTIEVAPVVRPHSVSQRNYYWKWLRAFGEFCGTTPDETHEEILCQAYGTEYTETRFGIKRRPVKRSSEANRPEYSLLIDTLTRTAAEMDFVIPPPTRKVS